MTRARTLKNVEKLTDICIFDRLFLYDMLQYCLGIEAQSLYDQIDSKLIGSNIYLKKHDRKQRSIKTIALSQLLTV